MERERTQPPTGRQSQPGTLDELRAEIDRVDHALLAALIDRFRLAAGVGVYKGTAGILVLDPRREAEIVSRACRDAREAGVPDEGVRGIFWAVIDYCRGAVESEHRRLGGDRGSVSS